QGTQCAVAYAAAGGVHKFQAFIARPSAKVPSHATARSNLVTATWVGVRVDATFGAVVGPGRSLTVTATSTAPVDNTTNALQIYDEMSGQRLTYCTHGTSCSISIAQQAGGARWIVGAVGALSDSLPTSQNAALSQPLQVTWLAVSVSAHSSGRVGDQIYVHAHVNADITASPWSIGILDERGQLIAAPCKNGADCTAAVTLTSPSLPRFMAAVGAPPSPRNRLIQILQPALWTGPAQLGDVQARSGLVEPTRLLWGVDSCKSFAQDAIGNGLYLGTAGALGWPDFWGRYLTDTVCPGITGLEIATAHHNHVGILPIYNDFLCSNVAGYAAGVQYAWAAVAAAQRLGIPAGRALAIDIEPPGEACPGAGSVDVPFISGWFDGVATANYVPAFYGNGTPGSAFASAWCRAVAARPDIAAKAFLWSFQPSLLGDFNKASAPGFGPEDPGCGGNLAAWQYQIGSDSSFPDVDQDVVTSVMPLWYP
ncbi:MAG TPA: glycoside hydrolase domain-containing protein, partial [Candidatus Dormibacteraeota bacterium]|nr:glycoside hydrolase domain-containing protein [Candidatus Dormibacteraeota bacterium]